tara:strand:+ start:237 stop:494 length:258 start_codon:yes stop_codon:yes gene_type:complete
MKVAELIKMLQDVDPESECILQKDGEGNGYSPLSGIDPEAIYIADSTYSGEVYSAEWSAEDADMEEDEWDTLLKKPRCVVFYPIN